MLLSFMLLEDERQNIISCPEHDINKMPLIDSQRSGYLPSRSSRCKLWKVSTRLSVPAICMGSFCFVLYARVAAQEAKASGARSRHYLLHNGILDSVDLWRHAGSHSCVKSVMKFIASMSDVSLPNAESLHTRVDRVNSAS